MKFKIIKAIKAEKEVLWNNRIGYGGMILLSFSVGLFLFINSIITANFWVGTFALSVFTGIGLFITWMLINLEKTTRQTLKKLQKKQSEWIIEYD